MSHPNPLQPPAGRYGDAPVSRGGRPGWVLPAVVLGVLATAVLVWIGSGALRDPVQWRDLAYSIDGSGSAELTFEVTKNPDTPVRCQVTAMSRSFAEVGTLTVDVGASAQRTVRRTVTVPTAETAVTVTVEGCSPLDRV